MATARTIPDISTLPDSAFLRLWAILALLQISRSTFYWWISQGRAPKPVRIGMRAVGWRVGDIRPLLAGQADTPIDPLVTKVIAAGAAKRAAKKAERAEAERLARKAALLGSV